MMTITPQDEEAARARLRVEFAREDARASWFTSAHDHRVCEEIARHLMYALVSLRRMDEPGAGRIYVTVTAAEYVGRAGRALVLLRDDDVRARAFALCRGMHERCVFQAFALDRELEEESDERERTKTRRRLRRRGARVVGPEGTRS